MKEFCIWLKTELKEHLPIIWEAVKEPLREIVIAIIPFALERLSVINEWWAVVLYLFLRGVDKWMYERGKHLDNSDLKAGLTRF